MDDELEVATAQAVKHVEDLNDRAQQIHERAEQLANPRNPSGLSDLQRVVAARRHEVEALERAIGTHEQAAELQQRLGRPDRAADAQARAAHERELLAQARAELAKHEADAAQDTSP
jgi:hypothetical protein